MKEDKIEIMAQPATEEADAEIRDTTLRKLQNLVDKDLKNDETSAKGETQSSLETPDEHSQGKEASGADENDSDEDGYDQDGFKVPVGKIPLDGQFSSQEMKELVELSKEEGLLKDDVSVRVTASNSICNHMEIVEPKSETA